MSNTEKIINSYKDKQNEKYGLFIDEMNDIRDMSENIFDAISNSFKYGYMQGRKSAVSDMRKAVL